MEIFLKSTFKFLKLPLNSKLAFHLLVGTLDAIISHLLRFNVSKTELSFPSMALPASHKFSSLAILELSSTSLSLTSHIQSVTNSYTFHLYWDLRSMLSFLQTVLTFPTSPYFRISNDLIMVSKSPVFSWTNSRYTQLLETWSYYSLLKTVDGSQQLQHKV